MTVRNAGLYSKVFPEVRIAVRHELVKNFSILALPITGRLLEILTDVLLVKVISESITLVSSIGEWGKNIERYVHRHCKGLYTPADNTLIKELFPVGFQMTKEKLQEHVSFLDVNKVVVCIILIMKAEEESGGNFRDELWESEECVKKLLSKWLSVQTATK